MKEPNNSFSKTSGLLDRALANRTVRKLFNIKTRTLLVLCIVFIFSAFIVNLLNRHFVRDYRSDDVANQYIVQSLISHHGGHGIFPADSFVIHFPLYLLTDLVIHDNNRTKLFLQAFLLGAMLLTSTLIVLIYYLRRMGLYNKTSIIISTLVLSFIFSIPIFAEYVLMINHRQLEVGLMLLLLLPVHQFLSVAPVRATRRNILYAVLYVLALGMLWYDDPYFMYIMAAGAVLTTVLIWISRKISWQKIGVVAAVLLSSAVLAKLYEILFEKLGIYLAPNGNSVIVDSSNIFSNLQNTIANFFLNFNGGLFGVDVLSTNKKVILPLLSGAVLALFAIASFIYAMRHSLKDIFALRTLLATTALALILFFALTQTGSTIVERYFMTVPILLLPLIIEFTLYLYRSTYYRVGQLVIAVVLVGLLIMVAANVHGTVLGIVHRNVTAHNSVNYALINEIERTGYKKGYGNYWQAPINTYLSHGKVTSLPIVCIDGRNRKVHWLVDENMFTAPAKKTFLIVDSSIREWEICSTKQIERQFGKPAKTVSVDNVSILLYNYDITPKMPDFYVTGSTN